MVKQLPLEGLKHWMRFFRYRWRYPGCRIAATAVVDWAEPPKGPVQVLDRATMLGGSVGRYTYISNHDFIINSRIGAFCSLAAYVAVGGGVHPARDWVSTSPAFFSTRAQCGATFVQENRFQEEVETVVGNDVWIGLGAIVLPGVKVGDGAIVGAGAVVTRDVEPYAVVVGSPARTVRKRFADEDVAWLLKTRWWDRDDAWLQANSDAFSNIAELRRRCDNH